MRKSIAAALVAVIITLFTPSTAVAQEGCVINVLGVKVCGTLVGNPLPEVVEVTVRPDPIRIPGPTVTLPAPPAETVRVPGPTETVTERVESPSEAETITEEATPQPGIAGPSELPTDASTPNAGQPSPDSGTITATPEPEARAEVETRTKTETIVQRALLGTLASLLLAGLGLILLYLGYILGHKDAEKREDKFLKSLIGTIRGERT